MIILMKLVGNNGDAYDSGTGLTLRQEWGQTIPNNTLKLEGQWVLRGPNGQYIDFDKYEVDVARRNSLELCDHQTPKNQIDPTTDIVIEWLTSQSSESADQKEQAAYQNALNFATDVRAERLRRFKEEPVVGTAFVLGQKFDQQAKKLIVVDDERRMFEAFCKQYCILIGPWDPKEQYYETMLDRHRFFMWKARAALSKVDR